MCDLWPVDTAVNSIAAKEIRNMRYKYVLRFISVQIMYSVFLKDRNNYDGNKSFSFQDLHDPSEVFFQNFRSFFMIPTKGDWWLLI